LATPWPEVGEPQHAVGSWGESTTEGKKKGARKYLRNLGKNTIREAKKNPSLPFGADHTARKGVDLGRKELHGRCESQKTAKTGEG